MDEVDLGVLRENNAANADVPSNNAAAAAADDEPPLPRLSTRFAVHRALKNANFIGNSCFGGKADGTVTLS